MEEKGAGEVVWKKRKSKSDNEIEWFDHQKMIKGSSFEEEEFKDQFNDQLTMNLQKGLAVLRIVAPFDGDLANEVTGRGLVHVSQSYSMNIGPRFLVKKKKVVIILNKPFLNKRSFCLWRSFTTCALSALHRNSATVLTQLQSVKFEFWSTPLRAAF